MDRTAEGCLEQTNAVRWKVTIPLTCKFTCKLAGKPVKPVCVRVALHITFLLKCKWISCFRPVFVSIRPVPVLCGAALDRQVPTPATGIWYSPNGRVGEPCGRTAQIPSNGDARKGETGEKHESESPLWRFPSWRNKTCPSVVRGTSKGGHWWEKKGAEADGKRGDLKGRKGVWQQSSGTSRDLICVVKSRLCSSLGLLHFGRCLWFRIWCDYLRDGLLPGSSSALVNRTRYRRLEVGYNAGRQRLVLCFSSTQGHVWHLTRYWI